MAKASVILTCAQCGAEYTATKTCYNRKEADSWESYMRDKDGLCRECYAEEMRIKREAEKAAEKAMAAEATARCPLALPELTGSKKRVAWAADIRGKLIADLNAQGMKWEIIASGKYPADFQPEIDRLLETSSKAWIESRGKTVFGISIR